MNTISLHIFSLICLFQSLLIWLLLNSIFNLEWSQTVTNSVSLQCSNVKIYCTSLLHVSARKVCARIHTLTYCISFGWMTHNLQKTCLWGDSSYRENVCYMLQVLSNRSWIETQWRIKMTNLEEFSLNEKWILHALEALHHWTIHNSWII